MTILPLERPHGASIYEAIVTDEQNPIELRFYYRKEAEVYQRKFYQGLEEHNEYIQSEIYIQPHPHYREEVVLLFWK